MFRCLSVTREQYALPTAWSVTLRRNAPIFQMNTFASISRAHKANVKMGSACFMRTNVTEFDTVSTVATKYAGLYVTIYILIARECNWYRQEKSMAHDVKAFG